MYLIGRQAGRQAGRKAKESGHPVSAVRRASRILTSHGLSPATDETVEKLRRKHRSNTSFEVSSLNQKSANTASEPIQLTRSNLIHIIRHSPSGSSAGISGWQYEHLRILL